MFSKLPANILCIVVHVFLTTSQNPLYCVVHILSIVVHVPLTTSQHPLYCGTCFLNYQSTSFVLWYMFSQLPVNII